MYKYEITKYNPKFRDENRRYNKEDWTSISDIGKSFEEVLTVENYSQVEDSYINAIQIVMDYLGVPYLLINNIIRSSSKENFLEMARKFVELYSDEFIKVYTNLRDFERLDKEKVDICCRLLLREDIGCDLYFPRKMKVFIGYDYLMEIHTSRSIDTIRPLIEQLGLYVEKY
jgi:hypothetical protein